MQRNIKILIRLKKPLMRVGTFLVESLQYQFVKLDSTFPEYILE